MTTFKRAYRVEIDFDMPVDFAEQDRVACQVIERLVDEFWGDAAASSSLAHVPLKCIATVSNSGAKRCG